MIGLWLSCCVVVMSTHVVPSVVSPQERQPIEVRAAGWPTPFDDTLVATEVAGALRDQGVPVGPGRWRLEVRLAQAPEPHWWDGPVLYRGELTDEASSVLWTCEGRTEISGNAQLFDVTQDIAAHIAVQIHAGFPVR